MKTDYPARFYLRSFIRRGSASVLGDMARLNYCHLGPAQPLMMHPEPTNKAHAGAVRLTDLGGVPCGYIASEDADAVSARIRAGDLLLCRTEGPCQCQRREIVIWSDGKINEEERKTGKTRPKARGRALVGAHDGDDGHGQWGDDENPMREDWHNA